MSKYIPLIITVFLLLTGCSEKQSEIYTVGTGYENKTVIGYGIVTCDETITESIPNSVKQVIINCAVGDKVTAGTELATYYQRGELIAIKARTDGLIKKIEENTIEYFDMSKVKITAKINETDASDISVGMSVTVSGVGFDRESYKGSVSRISSTVERSDAGVFISCTVSIDEPDWTIIPGFSATIKISVPLVNQVLVPIESLKYDGEFFVYKIVDGNSVRTPVKSSTVCGDLCAVSGEITAGDVIVIEPKGD